jgi:pimeloyl-ACP methyl ester carboxylesterase
MESRVSELARFPEPVDLVGHDWGGGHVAPDCEWHDMAQAWQAPGVGEEMVAGLDYAPLPDRTAISESLGKSPEIAAVAAGALYRSAAQPVMADLGQHPPNASSRPGLVLIPTEDSYTGGEARARWAAEKAEARVAILNGLGHWWMIEDPKLGAPALQEFWAALD